MFQSITEEIAWLKRKINANPKSMLRSRLAERYLRMNEIESAKRICSEQLLDYDHDADAHLILAKCYIKSNRFDEASREIKRVLELEPNNLQAYKLDSDLKAQVGLREEALRDFERILTIDPLDAEIQSLIEAATARPAKQKLFEPLMKEAALEEEIALEPPAADEEAESDILDVIDKETRSELDEEIAFAKELEGDLEEPDAIDRELSAFESRLEELGVTDQDLESKIDEELNAGIIDGQEADFDLEEPLVDEEETDSLTGLAEEEEEEVPSVRFETSAVNDEAILPDIEDELEVEVTKDELDEEESRFSEILDDIFAPTMDEEERRQEETRSALEKVAVQEAVDEIDKQVVDEQVEEPSVQVPPVARPAPGPISSAPVDDSVSFDDFNPFDDVGDLTDESVVSQDARFESVEIDEPETEEQFVDFLTSVDQEIEAPEAAKPDKAKFIEDEVDFGEETDILPQPEPKVTRAAPKKDESAGETGELEKFEPDFPAAGSWPKKEERPKEKFVTHTLGEIYAAQGQYSKAIHVFETLLERQPDNQWYISKLEELREKLKKQTEG